MAMPAILLKLQDLDRDEILRLCNERGPMLASTVLVVLIAGLLASHALKMLAPPPMPTGDVLAAAPRSSPSVDLAAILNAHLFGTAPPAAGDPSSAPATSMNLFLAGTMAGVNPESGWAIIGENAQAVRVVRTGAQVPGGATLKAVYADRVVLDLGGRLESLMLPRLAGGGGMYPTRAASGDAGSMIDAVRTAIDAHTGADQIGQIVRPQPVFANGAFRGVRAYPGRNRAVFTKLGLMPGDLITAINGAQLTDVGSASSTIRNLGGEAVQLTIERHGQARQVTVDPLAIAQGAGAGANPTANEGPPEGET